MTGGRPAEGGRAFGAFRYRDFRLLWGGQVISHLGSWMMYTAQSWLVYELTGSPFLVGVTGLLRTVPFILVTLYAGTVVDRVDRRRLLFWVETLNMLLILGLGVLVAGGWINMWHIYASSLLAGAIGAFEGPTRGALLPHLVPRSDLMTAISLQSVVRKGSQVIGPALGGLFIAAYGVAGAFFINVGADLVLLLCIFLMRTTNPVLPQRAANPVQDVAEGLRYVRSEPPIAMLLLLQCVVTLFGSTQAMMVVFAKDVFHTGPTGLGFLQSAVGLGAVAGSLGMAAAGDVPAKTRLLMVSGTAFCLSVIAFGLSPSYALALPVLIVSGMSDMVFGSTKQTVVQMLAEQRFLGRVLSLNSISQRGLGQFAGFQAGTLATFMGVQWATAIGGGICLAALLVARFCFPSAWEFGNIQVGPRRRREEGGPRPRLWSAGRVRPVFEPPYSETEREAGTSP